MTDVLQTPVVHDVPRFVRASDPIAAATSHIVALLAPLETPRLAVPGGSAAAVLQGVRSGLGAGWRRVRLTWTDERCVPVEHEDSNWGAAKRAGWLDPDDPCATCIPLFDATRDNNGEEAALRADVELRMRLQNELDLVVLGMGPDGHVASLFPGRPRLHDGRNARFIPDSPKPPPERVTLTHQMLGRAGNTVIVAFGEAKREALMRLRAKDPGHPAVGLPRTTVFTDLNL